MHDFEWIIALLMGAALLAMLARRIGAPYPALLALGGMALAFWPGSPKWTLDPELALTLFVAPVLMDTAYDASQRDLRANWRPVAGLVLAAVGTTVIGVALVCRWLIPAMPWAVAVAIGAIVSPPDAAAATAVMRQLHLPYKVLNILEGESLLNDASALIIYRLALVTMMAGPLSFGTLAPMLLLTVFGSIAAGVLCSYLLRPLTGGTEHAPTALIIQFSCTFGVWILAEKAGLSGILTVVAFAMVSARRGGPTMPARLRVPIFAVWETVVFVLNAFAFVLIGLQLRPIWQRLGASGTHQEAVIFALVVLGVTVMARFAWVMTYSAFTARHSGLAQSARTHPAWAGGLVLSWAGMRGIVTLAAAFSVPERLPDGAAFPYRDLILLSAFAVVFGTLVLQGFTLKPLIRWLRMEDNDPVAQEVRNGRTQIYQALLASIENDQSFPAALLRKEYQAVVDLNSKEHVTLPLDEVPGGPLRRQAIAVARDKAVELREQDVIGDHAYRLLIQELDWAELSAGGNVED
ncbi:monovalent cation:H+ antiporter, CPA1 family [Roseateles sp. YR242]|uniref:cation:proton antiporter n=1 Tax=Roseateles sp. YR242 TaxID=1855305 RepID=UPI0008C49E2D|nr:sodium:proton antiporter [Roseateles sp. YR242]SEK61719.1 monovalent cation:H+ antiporter, CPA1 family [Roseateles sp. YR242]